MAHVTVVSVDDVQSHAINDVENIENTHTGPAYLTLLPIKSSTIEDNYLNADFDKSLVSSLENNKSIVNIVNEDEYMDEELEEPEIEFINPKTTIKRQRSIISIENPNEITHQIQIYRSPNEKLGLGLKFVGGQNPIEIIKNVYIESINFNSPAYRTVVPWGKLTNGDEIISIHRVNVNTMTRLECVKIFEESFVLDLNIKHYLGTGNEMSNCDGVDSCFQSVVDIVEMTQEFINGDPHVISHTNEIEDLDVEPPIEFKDNEVVDDDVMIRIEWLHEIEEHVLGLENILQECSPLPPPELEETEIPDVDVAKIIQLHTKNDNQNSSNKKVPNRRRKSPPPLKRKNDKQRFIQEQQQIRDMEPEIEPPSIEQTILEIPPAQFQGSRSRSPANSEDFQINYPNNNKEKQLLYRSELNLHNMTIYAAPVVQTSEFVMSDSPPPLPPTPPPRLLVKKSNIKEKTKLLFENINNSNNGSATNKSISNFDNFETRADLNYQNPILASKSSEPQNKCVSKLSGLTLQSSNLNLPPVVMDLPEIKSKDMEKMQELRPVTPKLNQSGLQDEIKVLNTILPKSTSGASVINRKSVLTCSKFSSGVVKDEEDYKSYRPWTDILEIDQKNIAEVCNEFDELYRNEHHIDENAGQSHEIIKEASTCPLGEYIENSNTTTAPTPAPAPQCTFKSEAVLLPPSPKSKTCEIQMEIMLPPIEYMNIPPFPTIGKDIQSAGFESNPIKSSFSESTTSSGVFDLDSVSPPSGIEDISPPSTPNDDILKIIERATNAATKMRAAPYEFKPSSVNSYKPKQTEYTISAKASAIPVPSHQEKSESHQIPTTTTLAKPKPVEKIEKSTPLKASKIPRARNDFKQLAMKWQRIETNHNNLNKNESSRLTTNAKRCVSVNDIKRAFENRVDEKQPKVSAVGPATHFRVSSFDSSTSEDGLQQTSTDFQRNVIDIPFGSISSLPSSTSMISPQELQQLLDEANQSLEESGTPSHEVCVVILHREFNGSLGLTLAGGADYETKEITVHKVLSGSVADRDGRIFRGDRVLSIAGKSTKGLTHREALNLLKAPRTEVLLVVSRGRQNQSVGFETIEETTNLIAAIDRAVEPLLLDSNTQSQFQSDEEIYKWGPIKTVILAKDGAGLGFSLEGGKGSIYGDLPLTVKKVFVGGPAEKCGDLKVGDLITSINNKNMSSKSRTEAWNYMKKLNDGDVRITIRSPQLF